MKKYKIILEITETYETEVEAKSLKDAKGKAEALESITNTPTLPLLQYADNKTWQYRSESMKTAVKKTNV